MRLCVPLAAEQARLGVQDSMSSQQNAPSRIGCLNSGCSFTWHCFTTHFPRMSLQNSKKPGLSQRWHSCLRVLEATSYSWAFARMHNFCESDRVSHGCIVGKRKAVQDVPRTLVSSWSQRRLAGLLELWVAQSQAMRGREPW